MALVTGIIRCFMEIIRFANTKNVIIRLLYVVEDWRIWKNWDVAHVDPFMRNSL